MPLQLWERVWVNNEINAKHWTYYKNEIADQFDKIFNCIIILTHKTVGKRIISIAGKCKHNGCRRFQLRSEKKDLRAGRSPKFTVVSHHKIQHPIVLARQLRGATRDTYKKTLKTTKPSTMTRNLVLDMDLEQYESGNSTIVKSDAVMEKVRSEVLLSGDLAKEDTDDIIALQKETINDPFIQKVISPFAVYMHSIIQYKVLQECHRRLRPTEEVVGFLDATGDVVKVCSSTSTHPILYYPLLIAIKPDRKDKTSLLFPVTDCLNSGHGAPNINSWLNDFNECLIKACPTIKRAFHRILSDFSYANFHGVLHAFQSMRIQEYLYICYKYAVGLIDFDILRNLTLLEMCKAHLSKTFVIFVRKEFPSKNSNKKTCYEQKYVVEVLCSMMTCRSYNVLKEIYRNLCIVLLSKYDSTVLTTAKDSLQQICTSEDMLNGKVVSKFKFDNLLQSKMDEMSECSTVFEYNQSILNLPIYKSSSFYYDFQAIHDSVSSDLPEDEIQNTKNSFYNNKILPMFMMQFSGIIPLWTSLTIPNGSKRLSLHSYREEDTNNEEEDTNNEEEEEEGPVFNYRKSNQNAESHMNIVKSLMKDSSMELGSGKIKATRFIKLLRPLVLSHGKRYLIGLRRQRLNHGPRPTNPTDHSKVKTKIKKHMQSKGTVKRRSTTTVKRKTNQADPASIETAVES